MAHRRAAAASSATAQARGQGKGRGRGKQILPGATHAQSAAQPLAPAHATGDAVPGSQGAAAGADAAQQQQRPRSKVLGPHNPIRQVLQRLLKPPSTSSSSSSSSNGNAPAGSAAAASPDGDASASSLGTASTAGGAGARTWSKRSAVVGDVVVPLPEPGEVQEAVLDTTQSIKRYGRQSATLLGVGRPASLAGRPLASAASAWPPLAFSSLLLLPLQAEGGRAEPGGVGVVGRPDGAAAARHGQPGSR